jgi:histidine triad (HIT) family protein
MNNCVFCNIISGTILSFKIFEDDNLVAILDINPITPGHTLIIPKQHFETLLDIPDDLLERLIKKMKEIIPAILKITNSEGFNLLQNNKRCSGQAIPHAHFHIIPRHTNDGVRFNWSPQKYREGEAEKFAQQISKELIT